MTEAAKDMNDPPASNSGRLADWQLPVGVDRPLWEYLSAPHIAHDYDRFFHDAQLLEFDVRFLEERFPKPGKLLDLGCGTGRVLVRFARLGFEVVGLDLSKEMLAVCTQKQAETRLPMTLVHGNLCDLSAFSDASMDYVTCMFSTLGMVVGVENRRRALLEIRRVLKPDGLFGLHLHNRWRYLADPLGRSWFLRDLFRRLFLSNDVGDKVMENYRGIPNLRIHLFSLAEIRRELSRAGLRLTDFLPIRTAATGAIEPVCRFPLLNADGWMLLARRQAS